MKQHEYTYQRESTVWAVYHWQKAAGGSYKGEKIATYNLREDARREVYKLNGWYYRP